METSATLTNFAPAHESYRYLRFPQVFEAAAMGIALCHVDGRILEGNFALAHLLGYDPHELAGLDPWKFHECDPASASNMLAGLRRGERDSFALEKPCHRKDGSQFLARLTVSLARDPRHDPAFLVVLVEDFTERHRLEQQLRQAERMEIIGRLTGGIAHDFNNLLTGFLLYCDLLLTKLEPDDPIRRHVEEIREAGEQGSALTQQLLSFARKQTPKPHAVALNQIVRSTENLLRRLIGEHIGLVTTLDPEASDIFADAAQVRQIILNLVLNARDALQSGGSIRVLTQSTSFPAHSRERSPGRAVALIVEDSGCGMSEETRAHLFEPFFTTKAPGEGTGMGLATVHRIVTEAGGKINVVSEPGRGTRIEVVFPEFPPEPQKLSQELSQERSGDPPNPESEKLFRRQPSADPVEPGHSIPQTRIDSIPQSMNKPNGEPLC
jgi:two-component system, cell cycle sensor histidine kinase and response regulator CckA